MTNATEILFWWLMVLVVGIVLRLMSGGWGKFAW